MTANRYFKIAKKLAGITRRVRFHDLRHSFGCYQVSNGTSIETLQKMMGHADIKTTARYARVTEAAVLAAGEAIDRRRLNYFLNSEGSESAVAVPGASGGSHAASGLGMVGPTGIEPATTGLGKLPGHPRSSAVIPDLANGRRFGRVCGHPRSHAVVRKRRNELPNELHESSPLDAVAGIEKGAREKAAAVPAGPSRR